MGLFDQLSVAVLDPIPRALFYGGLAALATTRFSERSPAAFLVAANAGVLVLSYTMWEKYACPLLVCLWYLRAREPGHAEEGEQSRSLAEGADKQRARI